MWVEDAAQNPACAVWADPPLYLLCTGWEAQGVGETKLRSCRPGFIDDNAWTQRGFAAKLPLFCEEATGMCWFINLIEFSVQGFQFFILETLFLYMGGNVCISQA